MQNKNQNSAKKAENLQNYGVFSPKSTTFVPIATNYRQKKDLQVIDFNCKSLKYIGRYIQTRTGDLYDVNVAL